MAKVKKDKILIQNPKTFLSILEPKNFSIVFFTLFLLFFSMQNIGYDKEHLSGHGLSPEMAFLLSLYIE